MTTTVSTTEAPAIAGADQPMKFDVRYEKLAAALAIAMRIVPTRSTLPVLSNVLVEVEPGIVTLTANNLDVAVRCTMPATVWVPGAITIPARLLSDYLAELGKNDSISFEYNPKTHKIALATGRYKANFPTIEAEDFPPIPTVESVLNTPEGERRPLSIPAGILRRCIALSTYAAATDDTRPVLAAVHVRIEASGVTMVATDGFRLSAVTSLGAPGLIEDNTLVRADVLRMIDRLLPGRDDEPAEMAFSPMHVYFDSGDVQLFGRVVSGEFPDYKRIIPNKENCKGLFVASRMDLLSAVRASSVMARDGSNIIRVAVKNGAVRVTGTGTSSGDSTVDINTERIEGEDVTVGMNGKYVTDVLERLTSEHVEVRIVNQTSPVIIHPTLKNQSTDESVIAVVMPMKVAG